jgi:hypothetical protein
VDGDPAVCHDVFKYHFPLARPIPPGGTGPKRAHSNRGAAMKRVILAAAILTTAGGCGGSAPTAPGKTDPTIRVRENIGGGVGPVNGGRGREYEGPASLAPNWAKAQTGR